MGSQLIDSDEDRFGTAKPEAIEETPELQALEASALSGVELAGGNTRVTNSAVFGNIRDEYVALFSSAVVDPDKRGTPGQKNSVLWYAAEIADNQGRYEAIQNTTQVPWYVVGIIHALECSFNFSASLQRGSPHRLHEALSAWPSEG